MIKFVYIDMGNVMLHFKNYYVGASRRFNRSIDEIKNVFNDIDDDLCQGIYSADELTQIYKQRLRLDDLNENIDDFYMSFFRPIPETHTLDQ